MKNLFTYFSNSQSSLGNLQSSAVGYDCRSTVGSPSGLDAKWKQNPFMRFAVVLTLIFTIGSGNAWGTVGDAITAHGNIADATVYYLAGQATVSSKTSTYYSVLASDAEGAPITGNATTTKASGTQYTFLIESGTYYLVTPNGYYVEPHGSSNGKLILTAAKKAVTVSTESSKIRITGTTNTGKSIQKNKTTAANFGSYGKTQNDLTLYVAGYRVIYDANGATGGTVPTDANVYTDNASATIKANTGSLVKTGYTFAGWNTAANGSGTDVAASGSATRTITAGLRLYAKWGPAGTSVSYSKAAATNGSFTLSPASSVTTTSSAQTVTVTCTPDAGYYVSAISATNPATCPSAITYGGSNNSRTVTYPTGANGSSTISVTFSPIWYLKGDFNSWGTTDPLTDITSNVATVTKNLSKTTAYEFKVYNAKDDAWYGNNGKIIDDISGWTFSTSEGNCKVFATVADDYTFNFNITNQQMQVIYPDMTHPNDAYVYLTNWWDCYVHYWYTDGGGDHALIDWGYDTQLSRHEEICETDYWCVPILDGYPKLAMKDNAGDPSNTTGDQTTASNAGKYITHNGVSWGWHNFDTYTVSYAGGGGTGSMSSHTDLCPGANQALSANTFAKTHYTFAGWHADVDVKVGGMLCTSVGMNSGFGTQGLENRQNGGLWGGNDW